MARDPKVLEVSHRIKDIRDALNISQKDMAAKLNISPASLSEMENGKSPPNFEMIYYLNREYGVNLYYFLYGEGDMFEIRESLPVRRLEKLCRSNPDVLEMLDLIEKSTIVRYDLLSRLNSKLVEDRDNIEKEINKKMKKLG